jgi:hypothetical protein
MTIICNDSCNNLPDAGIFQHFTINSWVKLDWEGKKSKQLNKGETSHQTEGDTTLLEIE